MIVFSAGTILGAAYFDFLPEALELVDESAVFIYIAAGFFAFFFLERFIYWYHRHPHGTDIKEEMADRAKTKGFTYLNLIGDVLHNFLNGI